MADRLVSGASEAADAREPDADRDRDLTFVRVVRTSLWLIGEGERVAEAGRERSSAVSLWRG